MKDYQKALCEIEFCQTKIDESLPLGKDDDLMQELVDKEKPMKPIVEQDEDDMGGVMEPWFRCQICGVVVKETDRYCQHCGQHLDWEGKKCSK